MAMSVRLRPGQAQDLPDIASVDIVASPNHPIVSIPFAKAADRHAVFQARFTYLFHHPEYKFIVATLEEEVVGFLIWRKPEKNVDVERWEPKLPDGTDLRLFGVFIPAIEQNRLQYDNDELYGMRATDCTRFGLK